MNAHAIVSCLVLISTFFSLLAPAAASYPQPFSTVEVDALGWIAYIGFDRNIWMVQPDGSGDVQVTTDASNQLSYRTPRWSPDGQLLAFASREYLEGIQRIDLIYIYSLDTRRVIRTIPGTAGGFDWLTSSQLVFDKYTDYILNDNQCPVSPENPQGLYVMDLFSGQEHPFLSTSSSYSLFAPQVSASTGSVIMRFDENATMYSGGPFYVSSTPDAGFQPLAGSWATCDWASSGRSVACDTWSDTCGIGSGDTCPITVYAPNGAVQSTIPSAPGLFDLYPEFSPDDQTIAVTATDGFSFRDGMCEGGSGPSSTDAQNVFADLISASNGSRRRLTNGIFEDWSPDGSYALVSRQATEKTGSTTRFFRQLFVVDIATLAESAPIAEGSSATWQPQPKASAEWIAYAGEDKQLYVIHPDGSGKRQISPAANQKFSFGSLAWSASGRYLLFSSDYDPSTNNWLWDSQTGTARPILSSAFSNAVWSPTDDVLAILERIPADDSGYPLYIFTPATSELVKVLDQVRFPSFNWLQDGKQIVFDPVSTGKINECPTESTWSNAKGIDVINLQTKEISTLVESRGVPLYLGSAAPDGSTVFFQEAPKCIFMGLAPGPLKVFISSQPENWIDSPYKFCSASPNGDFLACSTAATGLDLDLAILIFDRNFNQILALERGETFRWAPDSRKIAITQNEIRTSPGSVITTRIVEIPTGNQTAEVNGVVQAWSSDASAVLLLESTESAGNRFLTYHIDTKQTTDLDSAPPDLMFYGYPAWQPAKAQATEEEEVAATINLDEWIKRKNKAVEDILSPSYVWLLGQENIGNYLYVPTLDEARAQELIRELEADDAQVEPSMEAAFTRLVIQEESIARIMEHYESISNDQGEWWTDLMTIALKTMLAFGDHASTLDWILSLFKDAVHVAINAVADPELREDFRNLGDAFIAFLLNGTDITGYVGEFGVEFFLRAAVANVNARWFNAWIQPLLDQGVNSVSGESEPVWQVTGETAQAEETAQMLVDISRANAEESHQNYVETRALSDVASALVDTSFIFDISWQLKWLLRLPYLIIKFWTAVVDLAPAGACSLTMAEASGSQSFQPAPDAIPECFEWENLISKEFSQVVPSTTTVDGAAWALFTADYAVLLEEYSTLAEAVTPKIQSGEPISARDRQALEDLLVRLESTLQRGSAIVTPAEDQTWDALTLAIFQRMMEIKASTAIFLFVVDIPKENLAEEEIQNLVTQSFVSLQAAIEQNRAAIENVNFAGPPAGIPIIEPLNDPLIAYPGTQLEIKVRIKNIGGGSLPTGELTAHLAGGETVTRSESAGLESGQEQIYSLVVNSVSSLPNMAVITFTAGDHQTRAYLQIVEAQKIGGISSRRPLFLIGVVILLTGGAMVLLAGVLLLRRRNQAKKIQI